MTGTKRRKPESHFEIYLRGVFPEDVSIRVVADAVAALQRIVQDDAEQKVIAVNVLDILRTSSAVYRCVSSHPAETVRRLRLVGDLLEHNGSSNDMLSHAFPFLRNLSEVAQQTHSDVVIRRAVDGQRQILAMIRGYKQRRGIYCAVTRDQAKQLARRLYQRVVLEGEAVWLRGTWDIVDFNVARIVPYRKRPFSEACVLLREAGADRWDDVPDSDMFFSSRDPETTE